MTTQRPWLRAPMLRWLVAAGLAGAIAVGLSAGAGRPGGESGERWARLVALGDELAADHTGARLDSEPLTVAKAYLLAFHEAQDAGDLEHVLAVADRLDTVGELGLAEHVRHAAQALLEGLAR